MRAVPHPQECNAKILLEMAAKMDSCSTNFSCEQKKPPNSKRNVSTNDFCSLAVQENLSFNHSLSLLPNCDVIAKKSRSITRVELSSKVAVNGSTVNTRESDTAGIQPESIRSSDSSIASFVSDHCSVVVNNLE